jgi:hypothetical protein
MSVKTNVELKAQIDADIKANGNREITPAKHNSIETNIIDSYLNIKDGGNVVQVLTGYSTDLTPSDDKHFTPKKYISDTFVPLAGNVTILDDITFASSKGIKGAILNINAASGVTNVGNASANLNLVGLLINVTGNQKFLTSGTGLYNSTGVASILFAASEVINVATSGNINVTSSAGYVSVIAGANNYLRFSDGLNGFGGTATGESYLEGTSGLKVADNLAMFPKPGAGSSATYVNKYILSNHFQNQALSGVIEGIRNIVKSDLNTVASVKIYNAVSHVDGTVTDWFNFTTDKLGSGTITNAYHLYLGSGKLHGTNKWFLYNDDSSVHSLIKGNVTFEGKVIQSTGYAATKLIKQDAVAVPHTGTVAETTIYTVSLPDGIMGANSALDIEYGVSCNNDASVKNIRVKIAGTTVSNVVLTSSAGDVKRFKVNNRNATNSQVFPAVASASGTGGITVATSAIDFTASSMTLIVTAELADSADNIQLEWITVNVINPAV